MAETTKKSIKYLHKHFSDYLSNDSDSTIFLEPTDKEEIANIISCLNSSKVSGPNRVPYRILFPLRNEITNIFSRFSQPLFHDWCFSFRTQNSKRSSCFKERFKIRL